MCSRSRILISLCRNGGFLITGMMVHTIGMVALKLRTGGLMGAGILTLEKQL